MKKTFTIEIRPLVWGSIFALVIAAAGGGYAAGQRAGDPAGGDDRFGAYLSAHPEAVEKIVGNYMRTHPEALTEMFTSLLRSTKKDTAEAPTLNSSAAIASHAAAIFSSPHQVTLGNPDGDITLVEFFDYNCGYCKRALPDMLALLKNDSHLKIVLKEYPILGQESVEAARVAIALRMQDTNGEKYLAFHQALFSGHASAGEKTALDAARAAGADMARLQLDIASKEVSDTLEETGKLGSALNISGTPSYVVGHDVLAGAIGVEALNDRIRIARR